MYGKGKGVIVTIMKIKRILGYLWCCISPNGHVITEEEEDRLHTVLYTYCNRCYCPVKAWVDYDCKNSEEYWIQEID